MSPEESKRSPPMKKRNKVHPQRNAPPPSPVAKDKSVAFRKIDKQWKKLAEDIYEAKSNNYKSNYIHVERIVEANESLFAPLLSLCPKFRVIIAYILEDRLGWRVQKVDWTKSMKDWSNDDCRRVGCSLATFIRKRKTGDAAISAWRLHYAQLGLLFENCEGFEAFMMVIADYTLRDSIYGMVWRVTIGAVLSTVDAATDIYVISKYYSEGLDGQASAMLAMIR